jgi:hypothetical protein
MTRRQELDRRRYLAHREERKARQREYYKEHREEILLRKRNSGFLKTGTCRNR